MEILHNMGIFTLEIVSEGDMATIYTIRQEGHARSEYGKFLAACPDGSSLEESYRLLDILVTQQLADDFGVDLRFFRHEGFVMGLPPSPKAEPQDRTFMKEVNWFVPGFPLRLFCYPVSDKILIVFNGGEKKSQKMQEDSKMELKRREAESYAKRINNAIRDGYITPSKDGFFLEDGESQEGITLY